MEVQLHIPFKALADAGPEGRVAVQAGHLVLVLVGHELEEVVCHGLRQAGLTQRGLGLFDAPHGLCIALRVSRVLVLGEEGHTALDGLGQARGLVPHHRLGAATTQVLLKSGWVVGGPTAPGKGLLVVLHRHRVEHHGLHQSLAAHGQPAFLPGVTQEHGVGIEAVAHEGGGAALGVEHAHRRLTQMRHQPVHAGLRRVLPIGLAHKGRRGCGVAVEHQVRATGAQSLQGVGLRGHQGVTTQNQVGGGGRDAGGSDVLGSLGQQNMAPSGAAFLGQACGVLGDHALAFEVRGHADKLPHGDDAGATHAREHQSPSLLTEHGQGRIGQNLAGPAGFGRGRCAAQAAAFDGDKARAKTFNARKVFVAGALVDGALAAKLGLQRLHRQTVGLYRTVATAFTHRGVDDHTLVGLDQRTALAAAAFFGGAGLVVNDDGGAQGLSHLALDRVQAVAVLDGNALGQAADTLVFFRLVGDDGDALRAFGPHALRDLHHAVAFGAFTHLLTASHGHRVVVQDFVGDVYTRGNALAHSQQTAVKVSAIPQVGEDVAVVAERLLAHPRHSFTTHLGKAHGLAVHPSGHEVATNTAQGPRAFGHPGAGVVRAARTKPRLALGVKQRSGVQALHGALLRVEHAEVCIDAGLNIGGYPELAQALHHGARDDRGVEVGVGAQQCVGARVGHGPFATGVVALDLVKLAQDIGAHIGPPVVELFLELVFDDLAFLFDHQNLAQASGEFARGLRLQRPHHGDLVQAQANAAAGRVVQPQINQGLAGVVVGLAAGDQAQAVVRAFDDVVVQTVGAHIGQRGVPLVVKQTGLLVQGVVGPTDVHPTGGHVEVRACDPNTVDIQIHHRAGLDDFLDGFHTRPHPRETAHGKGVQAQVQNFLHRRGEKHRQAAGLEDVVALVRGGGAFGHVVVPGHGDHTAQGAGAGHVGVFEHVRAAVHAGAFAVPNAKHTIVAATRGRSKTELLRAPNGGGGQLFVHTGLEDNVLGF